MGGFAQRNILGGCCKDGGHGGPMFILWGIVLTVKVKRLANDLGEILGLGACEQGERTL